MRRPSRQISLKECYAILKLDKHADLHAVKHAYRLRAFELHPDLNPGNPDSSRQFQLLNEAYVALSAALRPAEEARQKQEAQRAREQRGQEAGHREEASGRAQAGARQEEAAGADRQQARTGAGQTEAEAGQQDSGKAQEENRNAGHAYEEQDVLRDLLNDPFARRVFEDIYSELNRQQASAGQQNTAGPGQQARPAEDQKNSRNTAQPGADKSRPKQSTNLHKGNLAWGTPKWNLDMSKGVKGVVKDWLRRQIDEEQKLVLPASHLAPGRRLRLQIRQGLSAELHTVEITLPPDFSIGKSVRLKGLGKRVGPWQGDLYLTLVAE